MTGRRATSSPSSRRARRARRRRLDAGPGALRHRRLALPGPAAGWSSARATSTRCSPPSTSPARTGTPLTMRGAGTSIAGNAVGPGIVVDTSRHLNRVLAHRPRGRDRRRAARHRARHPAARRDAARPALRPRPVHAHPLHDRRDGRQQRLRLAGAGLRPHRPTTSSPSTSSPARASGSGPTGPRARRAAARRARRRPPRRPSAPSSGRFGRQVSGYSLEHLLPEHGRDLDRFLVGSEGTLAVVARRHRPAGRGPAAPGARGARLPVDGRGRRRRTRRCCAHPLVACEGLDERIVDVVRARAARSRRCRAAPAGCSPRSPGTPRPRRSRPRAAVVADAGALDHRVVTDAAEQPRCGGSARTAPASPPVSLDRPGARRLGGRRGPAGAARRPTCATSTRCCGEHGLDGVPYGHFGDGCVHVRIDFELARRRRPRPVPRPSSRTRRGSSRRTAAPSPASTATAGPAPSCCRVMYSARGARPVRPGQGGLRPRRPAQPRGARRPAPGRRRPPAGRAAAPSRRAHACAGRTTAASVVDAVHRCTGVGKCLAAPGRRGDVPVLPGHPRREGLHPRPGPGAPGDGRRAARHATAGAPTRCTRRSTSAWPARAARATARPAWTWRPTRPRRCTSATGAGCARAATTPSAGCRAGSGASRRRPGVAGPLLGVGRWSGSPRPRPGSTSGAASRCRPGARCAPGPAGRHTNGRAADLGR